MLYFDNFPCVAALDAEQRGELLLLLYRYAMAADKAPRIRRRFCGSTRA
ncbi:MAG: hypothetical protein ACLUIX_03700 [Oscillospiraceae bacterium]